LQPRSSEPFEANWPRVASDAARRIWESVSGRADEGHEVFTIFRSGTPMDAAIAAWRIWMRRLVQLGNDVAPGGAVPRPRDPHPEPNGQCVSRCIATAAQPGQPHRGPAGGHRGGQPRINVQGLLLAAPFYNPDAAAVGILLDRLAPARVHLFITESTRVNGDRLARRILDRVAEPLCAGTSQTRVMHAKLVGVVAGSAGWILSGSAISWQLSRRWPRSKPSR
jgi:hypothetical protein